MKKRGFTLIELLAVIVVLAIIALIATPIVMNVITNAKKGAAERSAENYLRAAQNAISAYKIDEPTFNPSTCEIGEDGNLTCGTVELTVDVSGDRPTGGLIIVSEGTVTQMSAEFDGMTVSVIDGEATALADDEIKTYENGEEVYFDVAKGQACTAAEYNALNSNTGYNGFVNYSADGSTSTGKLEGQTSCLKFYAYNDTNDLTVTLLLDHNTTANVAWISNDSYYELRPEGNTTVSPECSSKNLCSMTNYGPAEVLNVLKSNTDSWKGTVVPTNYTSLKNDYTVDYSNYRARLLTIEEAATITETTLANGTTGITITAYDWLYKNAAGNRELDDNGTWVDMGTKCQTTGNQCDSSFNYGDVEMKGYWTISSTKLNSHTAWAAYYKGTFRHVSVAHATSGVRPVIEVLKNNLV